MQWSHNDESTVPIASSNPCLGFIGNTSFFTVWQPITGATSAAGVLNEDAAFLQLLNVTKRRII